MKKKAEIPVNNPAVHKKERKNRSAQRPDTYTRDEIKAQETDQFNPNNGPEHKSRKSKT